MRFVSYYYQPSLGLVMNLIRNAVYTSVLACVAGIAAT